MKVMGLRKSMARVVMAVLIVLLALVSFMPVYSQNDLNFEFVKQIQARHEDQLFTIPGVRAVGIGKEGKRFHLAVFVNTLENARSQLPSVVEGVTLRMILMQGDIEPLIAPAVDNGPQHRLAYTPPVPMGVSTSNNFQCGAGTLGFRVRDPITSTVGYITNSHVAASTTNQCPNQAPIGTPQFQPGRIDNDCNTATQIGTLDRFIPLVFGCCGNNIGDAAFVASDTSLVSNNILDIGVPTGARNPILAEFVKKSGRSSGLTTGQVRYVNVTARINYAPGCSARYVGSALVLGVTSDFAVPGDSGSVVIANGDGAGVGIVVGKTNALSIYIVINPLPPILSALGVELF
jgi:hypothetical protein